jgi:hypothetical protein
MKQLLGIVVLGLFTKIFVLIALIFPTYALSEEILPRDVERYCEVYMYSKRYGDVECSRSHLRVVERRCEGYLYSGKYGDIECSGSNLRNIERRCEFYMYSDRYGEIEC